MSLVTVAEGTLALPMGRASDPAAVALGQPDGTPSGPPGVLPADGGWAVT